MVTWTDSVLFEIAALACNNRYGKDEVIRPLVSLVLQATLHLKRTSCLLSSTINHVPSSTEYLSFENSKVCMKQQKKSSNFMLQLIQFLVIVMIIVFDFVGVIEGSTYVQTVCDVNQDSSLPVDDETVSVHTEEEDSLDTSDRMKEYQEPSTNSQDVSNTPKEKDEANKWKKLAFLVVFIMVGLYVVFGSLGGDSGDNDGMFEGPVFQPEAESDSSSVDASDTSSTNSSNPPNPDDDEIREALESMRNSELQQQMYRSQLELLVRAAVNEGVLTQDEAETHRYNLERAFQQSFEHSNLDSMRYIRQTESQLLHQVQQTRGL